MESQCGACAHQKYGAASRLRWNPWRETRAPRQPESTGAAAGYELLRARSVELHSCERKLQSPLFRYRAQHRTNSHGSARLQLHFTRASGQVRKALRPLLEHVKRIHLAAYDWTVGRK